MELKIGTYNVAHCGDFENWKIGDPKFVENVTIEKTAKTIADMGLDIVGLNEVYLAGEKEDYRKQTEKLAKLAGYPYYASAAGKDYGWTTIGNGLLSKYPIVNVQKIMQYVPEEKDRDANEHTWWEDRVLLVVDVDVCRERKRVIVTHFGLQTSEQIRIVEKACKIIDEYEDTVIMGDFNALPSAVSLAPLYERLKSAARETGNEEFTFASYAPERQIDYIFVPKKATVKSYTVHKTRTSDHRPISADIEF